MALSSTATATELWTYVDRAAGYERRGEMKAAIIEWKNALRVDPAHVDGRLALGRLYLRLGDGESAEFQLRRAAGLGAAPDQLVGDLSGALLMQKSYRQLIQEFPPSDQLTPPNQVRLLIARGHAFTALNRLDEAGQSFSSVLELGRHQVDAYQGLAFIAVRRGKLEQASSYCDEALALDPKNQQVILLKAEVNRRRGRYETAANGYREVLSLARKHPGALVGLARSRIAQQRNVAAARVLRRLRIAHPHNIEERYLRAALAYRAGHYPETATVLADLLSRNSEHRRALLLMAAVNYLMGEQEQALDRVRLVLKKTPGNSAALRIKAAIEMNRGGSADMLTVIGDSAADIRNDPWLAAMAARTALLAGHPDLGRKAIERALQSGDPEAQGLHSIQQAMIREQVTAALDGLDLFLSRPLKQRGAERIEATLRYLRQGKWQQAAIESRSLLKLLPNEALAHDLEALVLVGMGDTNEALLSLGRALELRPEFPPTLIALARIEMDEQQYQQAMGRADSLIAAFPERPMGYALRGDVSLAQGHRNQAIAAYGVAFEKADTALAVTSLSQRLVGLGGEERVIHKLEAWVRQHSGDIDLRVFLALQLQTSERSKAAMEHFRAVLDTDPRQLVALNELAVWHRQQDEFGVAEGYAERAFELQPGNPVIADTLGWVRLAQDRADEATPLLRKASEELPGVPLAHYHYGVLLAKSGDHQQARRELERALASKQTFPGIGDARKWLARLDK